MKGHRLRAVRESLHLTQSELAERLGVDTLQIWRYENEKTTPKADMIARVATELNVSSDYLLGLTDEPVSLKNSRLKLSPTEARVIEALRAGQRYEAVRWIVQDEVVTG